MSVPITNKIRMKEFTHPNAISQKTQGEYTFTVHWVGHVLKNIIELYPILKSNVVVLLKMLHLSLKPKIRNFKTTWVFFKIENGLNSGNAKSLYALAKLSFCKKVIENISAGLQKCSVPCQQCYQYDFSTCYGTIIVQSPEGVF